VIGSSVLPVLLGLASAACWGAADFSGGLASKRASVYGVVIVSQVVGVALLIGLALAFSERVPPPDHLLWGAIAGLCGSAGLMALYRALALGRMGIAAPVSAVVTAAVPVMIGALIEGWPGTLQVAGFGMALFGVWFISRTEDAALAVRDLGLPLLAGLGFGFFLVFIDRAGDASVLWPLVAARFASLGVVLTMTAFSRRPWLPKRNLWPLIALAGVLDAGGNAFFALAAQMGRLDMAAVLSSLYPASTVWLAWLILKERLTRTQSVGVVAALAAIVLITV